MSIEIKTVGVIGAGQMGSGIAQVCASAGFAVVLQDLAEDRLKAAVALIEGNLGRRVGRGEMTAEARLAALACISTVSSSTGLGDCDIIIEAATENEEVKRKIFIALCPHIKKSAILASNTSSISITRLASVTDRPERFIGIHFMNPVPKMQLVELIRGIATEDKTYEAAKVFVKTLGKSATMAEDFPAFIVNRILMPMINEAIYTLYEGVGSVDSIDTAMRLGANHPTGAKSRFQRGKGQQALPPRRGVRLAGANRRVRIENAWLAPECHSAAFSAAPPARNCASRLASSSFAAFRWRSLTWPTPRIFSGIDASATATAWVSGVSFSSTSASSAA